MKELYAGVDVGSREVRVGLMDSLGKLKYLESFTIDHHIDELDDRFITQSSNQISEGLRSCLSKLKGRITADERIVSISCSATCSMAVFKQVDGVLVPYSVQREFKDHDQNVVFWMDSRAVEQTKQINEMLKDGDMLKYYGGSFIEEMAIPKVKYLIDNIPKEHLPDIVFLDLHSYLNHVLLENGKWSKSVNVSNSFTKRGIDGELQGWSADFLNSIGLNQLTTNYFKALAGVTNEIVKNGDFHHLPLSGSKIGVLRTGEVLSQGTIDSYAGWIGSCGESFENTLVMVAGTSTCFIIGHNGAMSTINGIWGPYEGIVPDLYVSEGGQSTTGKLIEHLFETHPASKCLEDTIDRFFKLEREINRLEELKGLNIHILAKNIYNYGDLSGNRTPYGDSSMRGVFFGESVDVSMTDLILKYISILEFISFQAKQIVELFKNDSIDIKKIVICGSQAKNDRLIQLISNMTGISVEISGISPELSGVRGAALLGLAGYRNQPLSEVIPKTTPRKIILPNNNTKDTITKILEKKYEIMKDIADRQKLYNSWINSIS